ncbi:Abi family protein [Niallia circulans]|uniref:Abi family protein n=1 Tax=Niallia circulans TaxID=1397 RepID=UPI0026EB06F8|nr:Abi family protein [Niallia circulans]
MGISTSSKIFKTHSEQLEILRERGLIIEDEQKALKYLRTINYYRLTGYMLQLKHNDRFINNSTFEQAIKIYEFDTELRRLFLEATEYIEITLRSQLAYSFSNLYGGLGYKKSENFHDELIHTSFLKIVEKKINESRETFVKHHKMNYDTQLPLWVAVEIFTMDILSKFYANMHIKDKKILAEFYGVNYSFLTNWLHSITTVRNISAHYSRLYNRKFTVKVRLFKEISLPNNKLVSVVYILKRLLPNEEWMRFFNSLQTLFEQYSDVIQIHHLGFIDGWDKHIKL